MAAVDSMPVADSAVAAFMSVPSELGASTSAPIAVARPSMSAAFLAGLSAVSTSGGILGHVAPIRRFAVPAPIVVGYPYYYGYGDYDDPYLDYPPEQQCVVERRLVQTIYGARWRRVTLCY